MTEKKYEITVAQSSGFNSDATQNQKLMVGDHYHIDKYKSVDVYAKLVTIHQGQITFDPHSLKDIIVKIDEGIKDFLNEQLDFSTSIDINKKNEINNHSKEYFEQFVELDFYPQFHKLDKFFGLKENQLKLQPSVDRIIKTLNRQICAFQGNESFEAVLLKISSTLIDNAHDHLHDKEHEILLILYYFYCNCCIGKKTTEEKNVGS